MNTLFDYAEACLHRDDIDEKPALTHEAMQLASEGRLSFDGSAPVRPIAEVRFPKQPRLLPPQQMPKRKLTTPEGVAAFFHAIAHVEFVAIYLPGTCFTGSAACPNHFIGTG